MDSFKEWYNEGMFGNAWDKAKQWGNAALNWSPANKDTRDTYPSSYANQSVGDMKAGRALGNWPSANQQTIQQPQAQQKAQQPQPKKKTVGFNISDMDNLKVAITDYLGLISRYVMVIREQLKAYPQYTRNIIDTFEKDVGPAYADLHNKLKWIGDMNTLARSQYEWAVDDEVLLEAVKVSYKRFEEMVQALQALAQKLKYWVYGMVKNLPEAKGRRLKAVYEKHILRQQAFVGRQVQWLQGKLQQLMQANNISFIKGISFVNRD